ncbi:MAG TPA: NADH-quinone oxidoreductase subunit N [Chloroflexota bacterium]|nr:NADH-quinone oxidoreductase subunit N [Chloroflexota bacterium]
MEFTPPEINLLIVAPVLIVMAAGSLGMVIDLFTPDGKKGWAVWLAAIGLLLALVQNVALWNGNYATFIPQNGVPMVIMDNFAIFLNTTFLLTGLLVIPLSRSYLQRTGLETPEYYMLLLFSISGMMLMGMANDLILVFLALEVLSIPLYIMCGMLWPRAESEESAMKYFLLGAFSSAIFVFGIALVYGATMTTAIPLIFDHVAANGLNALIVTGLAFLMVGAGFKVAAVPFHMWTPDVYEGAPTPVTAFMSVGAKVAGFAVLLRVLVLALPQASDEWVTAVAVLSTLTLIIGNVVAIRQGNIKRMLAYSSIAHAGYILIAVAAAADNPAGVSSALFYMFAYLFTNLGAFGIVIALERNYGEGNLLDDFKGLAKRHPWLSLAMAYFMLSLTGIPPTGGFSAKFYVFGAAIEAELYWLVLIGVITSVISGYYYLRVVYLMYMFDGEGELITGRALQFAVFVMAISTLVLGLFPEGLFNLTAEATFSATRLLAGG